MIRRFLRRRAPRKRPVSYPASASRATIDTLDRLDGVEPAEDTPRRYHETDSGRIPDEVFKDIARLVGKTDWRIHKLISVIETANDALAQDTAQPLARQEAHYARRGRPEWGTDHPIYQRMISWKNPRGQVERRGAYEDFYFWEPKLTVQCHSEGFGQIMGKWIVSDDPDRVATFLFAQPDAYRREIETLDGQVRVYRHFVMNSPVLWGAMRYLTDTISGDVVRDQKGFRKAVHQIASNWNGPKYKLNHWDTKFIKGLIRNGLRSN